MCDLTTKSFVCTEIAPTILTFLWNAKITSVVPV